MGELHKVLAHKRSTLTSILDRLVKRALVTRETGAIDRRTFVVTLTRKGERAAKEILHHLADLERAVRQKFPAETVEAFLAVLAAVEDAAAQRTTGKTKTS